MKKKQVKPTLEESLSGIKKWMNFLNEDLNMTSEPGDDIVEFTVPAWSLSALINGDRSGLTPEDEKKLDRFVNNIAARYGNANFHGADEDDCVGFKHSNDIDNLGDTCYKIYIKQDAAASAAGPEIAEDEDAWERDDQDEYITRSTPKKRGSYDDKYTHPDEFDFYNNNDDRKGKFGPDMDENSEEPENHLGSVPQGLATAEKPSAEPGKPDYHFPEEPADDIHAVKNYDDFEHGAVYEDDPVPGDEDVDDDVTMDQISLKLAIFSRLSDIQESHPDLRGVLNYVKILVRDLASGKTGVTTAELDTLYQKYVGESVQEAVMKRIGFERTGLKHGAKVSHSKLMNEGAPLTGVVNHLHMKEGVGVNWGGNNNKLFIHKKEDLNEVA